MTDDFRERLARRAYEATSGEVSDEEWRGIWNFHTNPDAIAAGGPWYLLQVVDAVLVGLADTVDPRAPIPELKGSFPIVIFFSSAADRDEFIAVVREAKPGLVARDL